MNDKIHATAPDLHTIVCDRSLHFIKDLGLSISVRWNTWDCNVDIADISLAQKRGSECTSFTLCFKNKAFDDNTGFNLAQEFLIPWVGNFGGLFAHLKSLNWVNGEYGYPAIEIDGATIHRRERAPMRVYSPFAEIAPLKALPAKWTVAHVVRALWNGQFQKLVCNGKYTDDYAHDAAVNFCQGEIKNGRAFARKLIESPSGWWASTDGSRGGVSICCHSFDSNSFYPVLNPAPGAQPANDDASLHQLGEVLA